MKTKLKPKFFPTKLLTTLSLLIIPINVVNAKPIVYDFQVNVTEGSLKGSIYQGFIRYDDEKITGVGEEIITVEDGLTVCMNFFNQNFDQTKDVNYPQYPKLTLNEGKPESLDFWIESNPRRLWWNQNGWLVTLQPPQQDSQLSENCL